MRNKIWISNKVDLVSANLDALVISEAKIDETFPELQFIIERFSEPYRLDCTVDSGRILLCVREDIPTKCIKGITVSNSFEGLFTELNFKNKKWLLWCSCNQEDFIWQEIWQTSIYLFKVRWNDHLVNYFPLMYRYGIDINIYI